MKDEHICWSRVAFLEKSRRKPLVVGFLQQRACKLQICVLRVGQSADYGWQQQWTAWSLSHTKNLLKDFSGTGALKVSTPTSCSKQDWLQSQSKLVRALPSWVEKSPRMEVPPLFQALSGAWQPEFPWLLPVASCIYKVLVSSRSSSRYDLIPPPLPPPEWPKPLSQRPLDS